MYLASHLSPQTEKYNTLYIIIPITINVKHSLKLLNYWYIFHSKTLCYSICQYLLIIVIITDWSESKT